MARYLQVAKSAQETIDALMMLIPDDQKSQAAPLIAYVYNYGIRTSPRPTQSTVRFNAVREACKNLPVVVTMSEVRTESGRTFNALRVNNVLEPVDHDD